MSTGPEEDEAAMLSQDGHGLCATCEDICALWDEDEYEGHELKGWVPLAAVDPVEGRMECPVDSSHESFVDPVGTE